MLITKRQITGKKYLNDSKAFIEYSNDMDDGFENIEEYNPNKNIKYWSLLIIWLLISLVIKKVNPAVTELFIRVRKLNICFVFITQPYFAVPENRLNYTHYLIMEIPKKRELQQIYLNIHQILTLEALWIFTKNVFQNHILL